MRILSLDQIIDQINLRSTDLEHSDKRFYLSNLLLFWNFLSSQPRIISLFDRIERNNYDVEQYINFLDDISKSNTLEKIFFEQNTSEKRGIFCFFVIKRVKDSNKWTEPYDTLRRILPTPLNYEESKIRFNELILMPFISLLNEMLEESRTDELSDYFSRSEKKENEERINEIIEKLEKLNLGNEILYEELQDLKTQLGILTKKNWIQLLKGKLIDAGLEMATEAAIKLIWKGITGQDFLLS
jgi:hypothetical protein